MNKKKNEKSNLEKKRTIFFQIGLLIALIICVTAFEWTNNEYNYNIDEFVVKGDDYYEELPPITKQENPKPPEPPKNIMNEIEMIKDDIEIDDELIIPDSEMDIDDDIEYISYQNDEDEIKPVPYYVVEETPYFMDGENNTLLKWIADNSNYPKVCVENNITGTVWIGFTIDKTGEVIDVHLLRSVDPFLDKEAIRIIKNMPKWNPGIQNGKKVPVPYQIPVKFILN